MGSFDSSNTNQLILSRMSLNHLSKGPLRGNEIVFLEKYYITDCQVSCGTVPLAVLIE